MSLNDFFILVLCLWGSSMMVFGLVQFYYRAKELWEVVEAKQQRDLAVAVAKELTARNKYLESKLGTDGQVELEINL